MALLSDPDIRAAFGARSLWQVIDTVASGDLGGAKSGVRYRTLAESGAVILAWLANRAPQMSSATVGPILELDDSPWRSEFLYSRASTIYGGTAEIQRNIIARRLLDLGKG